MSIQLTKPTDRSAWAEVLFQIHYPKSGGEETKLHGFLTPYVDDEGEDIIETFLSTVEDDPEALMDCYKEILLHAFESGYDEIEIPLFPDRKHTGLDRKEILHAAGRAYLEVKQRRAIKVHLLDDCFTPEEEAILSIAEYIEEHYIPPIKPSKRYSVASVPNEQPTDDSCELYSVAEEFDDGSSEGADFGKPSGEDRVQYSADYDTELVTAEYSVLEDSAKEKQPSPPQRFDPARGFFQMDESFGETVLRLIRERGMTDADCYNKANITRAAFYKIRQSARNPESMYRPSKQTAMALAVALELSLQEAADLLERAGYAFSHSSKGDIIVEYFLLHRKYDLFELNEVLLRYDQPLLGSMM